MTSDETRHSVLRSNRNAFWGVVIAAIVLIGGAVLTALTWGAALLIPGVAIVGVERAANGCPGGCRTGQHPLGVDLDQLVGFVEKRVVEAHEGSATPTTPDGPGVA